MIDLDTLDSLPTYAPVTLKAVELAALIRVVRAAFELTDGEVVYADEHGDLIRAYLVPALAPFRGPPAVKP